PPECGVLDAVDAMGRRHRPIPTDVDMRRSRRTPVTHSEFATSSGASMLARTFAVNGRTLQASSGRYSRPLARGLLSYCLRGTLVGNVAPSLMHGISYGLLVETRHDTPVAGGTPYPRATRKEPFGSGLRAWSGSMMGSIRRPDITAVFADWLRAY